MNEAPLSPAGLALTVALAQNGDRRAMDRLLREHQDALLRHACAVTGDADLALDATQAALLLIARRLGSLREPRWFRAWAYRIVTREAVRAAKRRGRERLLFDNEVGADPANVPSPEPEESAELIAQCADAIDRLPAASGMVAGLHYREGLTLIEIAEALEIPLGTVKSRLAYALARLREAVAREPIALPNGDR